MKRIFPLFLILTLLFCCFPLTVLAVDYNGHDLPDINTVWTDKETYTEAIIQVFSDGSVSLYLVAEELEYSNDMAFSFVSDNKCSWQRFSLSSNNNEWVFEASGRNYSLSIYLKYCVWATYDIYDGNGNLYLAGGSTDSTEPTEPESSGTIMSITVDCDDSADIYPGDTVQFWANVNGNGTYDTSVTWSFYTGGTDSTTTLDQNGLLTIGEHENSLYLAVTATSVADPTISGTRSIKLNLSGSTDSTESTEPTDATTGSSGPDYSDQFADVNQNLEDVETAVGEVGDAVDAVGDKVDDLISGGEAGSDLTDKSGQLGDDLGDINDFEQSQKDVLDNSMEDLKSSVSFTDFIPAMSFVQTYINRAWAGVPSVWVLYTVPLFLGLFFYICSRMPGVTRWRAAPPPKASKKKG